MRPIAPLTAALLVVLVAANIWLVAALMQGFEPSEERPRDGKGQRLSELSHAMPPSEAKSIVAFKEITARPVFFKTRQPYVPPPPAPPPAPKVQPPPPPAPSDPGLVLGGVVINGSEKKAYVVSKADAQGTWLEEGEAIKGWTLHSIDPYGAKLHQSGRTVDLHLYPPQR